MKLSSTQTYLNDHLKLQVTSVRSAGFHRVAPRGFPGVVARAGGKKCEINVKGGKILNKCNKNEVRSVIFLIRGIIINYEPLKLLVGLTNVR